MGAETTDCDSPESLIDATFAWIETNLKGSIDFIIWTGDSARHDNDEKLPRSVKQVEDLNRLIVDKFVKVFGKGDNVDDTNSESEFTIPIVPTFGNNDVLPHNIFSPGPNSWTQRYLDLWKKFIPEEQRHSFARGGWFYVEVIPNELAAFSLNTLYFFSSNTAVDGCARKSDPGYEQMEWLRVQLQFLRQRGMKAIITGHVPPARTESKNSWDETCWHKYTFWLLQYRDVLVGSLYGHMNIDHFLLQDSQEVKKKVMNGKFRFLQRMAPEDDVTAKSLANYLTELRIKWSRLPELNALKAQKLHGEKDVDISSGRKWIDKPEECREETILERIGGRWGERYSVTLVSASVVPNYFPSLRVFEYNTTGLGKPHMREASPSRSGIKNVDYSPTSEGSLVEGEVGVASRSTKKHHKEKKPKFIAPDPPSKSSPPGPAYSPQTFTWLRYTQYYANLTTINNDFVSESSREDDTLEARGWHEGKHSGKRPHERNAKPHPKRFNFEIEYDTANDKVFALNDLTVRSYIDLAARIGKYKSENICGPDQRPIANTIRHSFDTVEEGKDDVADPSIPPLQKNRHKHKNRKNRKAITKTWFTFVRRAFVGARDDNDLYDEFSP